jgi:hypothetical protein
MNETQFDTLVKRAALSSSSRRQVLGTGLLLGVASVTGWQSAHARDKSVLPPQAKAFGRSAGEWTAAWVSWSLAHPDAVTTCELGQSGKVWFLPGLDPDPSLPPVLNVTCTVPTGKALLVPIFVVGEATADECEAGVSGGLEGVGGLDAITLTVDGRTIPDLGRYEVEPAPFPPTVDPTGELISVACGYALRLHPLPPGEHIIHLTVAGTPVELTWIVVVEPGGRGKR